MSDSQATPGPTVDGLSPGSVAGEHAAIEALREVVRSPATQISQGVLIGERYRLEAMVGRGGMGVVWRARDEKLGRAVAIKVLAGVAAADQLSQMRTEARAVAKLAHPNVVAVFDVGEFGARPYLVMELVRGTDFRAWMQRDPPPDWRTVVDALTQAGRGLTAAHAAGLVHRDFKPGNVLVGDDGRVRVVDFGLAREHDERTPERGGVGVAGASETVGSGVFVVGTPPYMAPEQQQGETATAQSDVFSFAVTLFEALYGVRPYGGADANELLASKVAGPPTAPPAGDVPSWIFEALRRGLEPEPSRRWPSVRACLEALARSRARPTWWALGAATIGLSGWIWATLPAEGTEPDCSASVESFRAELGSRQRVLTTQLEAAGVSAPLRAAAQAQLDDYNEAWSGARGGLCDVQAGARAVPGLRVEYCLERSKRSLFERLDAAGDSTDAAQEFAGRLRLLPDASDCTDVVLAGQQPLPDDPDARRVAEELQEWAAFPRSDAELPAAFERLDAQLDRARTVGHLPTTAAVSVQGALWATQIGNYPAAESLCAQAHALATEGGADRVAMHGAMECITVAAWRGDLDSARRWEKRARALATRTEAEPWEHIEARADLAAALGLAGEFEEAKQFSAVVFADALDLQWHDRGSLHVFVQLGLVANYTGDHEEAIVRFEAGLEKAELFYPGNDALVFPIEGQLGAAYRALDRREDAEALLRRVLARQGVPLHIRLDAHLNLVNVLGDLRGRRADADVELAAARGELEAAGYADSMEMGGVWVATGHLERKSGNPDAARRAYAKALSAFEGRLEPGHVMFRAVEEGLSSLDEDADREP